MDETQVKREQKSVVCRVCLDYSSDDHRRNEGKGLSLFEKHNGIFIYEKFCYVTNLLIKEDDKLPDKICSTCLLALEDAYNFKQRCINSNSILHSTAPEESSCPQLVDVLVKEECDDDVGYDCLVENIASPELLVLKKSSVQSESVPKQNEIEIKPIKPFKSKAIDLQLECHDCGGFFKSKCKLRVHWKKVHQPKQLTCPMCKKVLKSYKAYHRHLKRRSKQCITASKVRIEGEGRSRIYHCTECNSKTPSIQNMMAHIRTHTGEKPFACNMCDKAFSQYSSLSGHKENIHGIIVKEGMCETCGKYFKSRSKLYRHMQMHSNFKVKCKICHKEMKSYSYLKIHMLRHSGVKRYTCELCAKSFYTSSGLCNHKSNVHNAGKIFKCHLCSYKSLTNSALYKHRRKHTGSNISCEICGGFVNNIEELEKHQKRHFDRNFECIHCPKRFNNRKNLGSHVRKQHKIYALTIKTKLEPPVQNVKEEKVS